MRIARTVVAVVALLTPVFAKSPVSHEAIWLMKRVGPPVVSPNGKWVVFSVTEPDYDEKLQRSDLWIVPTDGSSKPRQITFTRAQESDVAWSPDSTRIAFSATRDQDEASQIYVLNLAAGGEAQRITNLSTAAASPQWSPDGRRLLFTSMVYPGAADDAANRKIAEERKARKFKARVYDSFPIRYWDHWLDDRQVHVFVQAADPGATAKDLLAGTKLVSEPGFGGLRGSTSESLQPVWAPDGKSIVFVATTRRNAAAYANVPTHLYRVSIEGGEPQPLTSGPDSYASPSFSPDGKSLYAIHNRGGETLYSLDRIARFSWPNPTTPVILTEKTDRSVTSYAITPDSSTVYFLAEDAGHEKVYRASAKGGDSGLAFDMSSGVYTNLTIPAKASAALLIANWESAVNPAEVVRIDPARGTHTALTSFNAARAAEIDWQPLRHFWFTASNGKKIHSMIALPPAFDENKKYPLFVLMHGGPHTMWRDHFFLRWNYHLIAQPGYVVLLTNYTGSTGFGEKFSQEIQGDPLAGPAKEINEAADEAIRRFPFIDGSRQAAGGASYGGHLANWMQATTTRYKCLVSHAGLINLESQWGTSDTIYHRELMNGGPVWEQGRVWREQNPIRFAKNFRTPILLTVGENDFRVPLNQTLENWSVLQRLQIPSRLIVFPEENHWIRKGENSRFFYSELHAWLKKYLN